MAWVSIRRPSVSQAVYDRWPLRQSRAVPQSERDRGASGFYDDAGVVQQALDRPDESALAAHRHRRGDRQYDSYRYCDPRTSSTVPLRTICSALSHSALTVASSAVFR